jgi:transglutaminase-like putative cysteine protease
MTALAPSAGPPRRVSTYRLAGGDEGTRQTLRAMARIVREDALTAPVLSILARIIPSGPFAKDRQVDALQIRSWLQRVWRFRRDPLNVELVHRPEPQLAEYRQHGYISGDCDDASVLGAVLGRAIGLQGRFVVLGFMGTRGPMAHVYAELCGPDGWVDLDITRPPHRPSPSRGWIWSI